MRFFCTLILLSFVFTGFAQKREPKHSNKTISIGLMTRGYYPNSPYISYSFNRHQIGIGPSFGSIPVLFYSETPTSFDITYRDKRIYKISGFYQFYRLHLFKPKKRIGIYFENSFLLSNQKHVYNDEFVQTIHTLRNNIGFGFKYKFWRRFSYSFSLGYEARYRFAKQEVWTKINGDEFDIYTPLNFHIQLYTGVQIGLF